jgi:hypothetical protein
MHVSRKEGPIVDTIQFVLASFSSFEGLWQQSAEQAIGWSHSRETTLKEAPINLEYFGTGYEAARIHRSASADLAAPIGLIEIVPELISELSSLTHRTRT